MSLRRSPRLFMLLIVVAAIAVLVAAGRESDAPVLRIAERAVSRAEFDEAFSAAVPDSAREDPEARREFFESFINRQLLVQAALDAGLFEVDSTRAFLLEGIEVSALVDRVQDVEIRSKLEVSPDEVEAFYAKLGVRYDMSHIVVATEEEAERVKARLAAGEDFEALAREVSLHVPSAENGGQVAPFVWGTTSEALLQTVDSMEPGEIRGPIETDIGYHVIRLNDRLPNEKLKPLAESWDFFAEQCGIHAAMETQRAFYAELRRRYHFEPNWPVIEEETRLIREALAAAADSLIGASPGAQQALAKELLVLPDDLRDQPLATWDFGQYTVRDHRAWLQPLPGLGLVDRRNPHVSLGDATAEFNRRAMAELARSRGYDKDPELRRRIELKHESLAVDDLYVKEVLGKIEITEADEREYYEQHRSRFEMPPQVKLALVQYERDGEAAAEMQAALDSQAADPDSVLRAHVAAGLVRERVPQGKWVTENSHPVLYARAAGLEPGAVARTVDEDGYWTVFILLEREPGGLVPFEEVRQTVQKSLTNERADAALNELLTNLKQKYPVWINDAYMEWRGESD